MYYDMGFYTCNNPGQISKGEIDIHLRIGCTSVTSFVSICKQKCKEHKFLFGFNLSFTCSASPLLAALSIYRPKVEIESNINLVVLNFWIFTTRYIRRFWRLWFSQWACECVCVHACMREFVSLCELVFVSLCACMCVRVFVWVCV